LRGADGEIGSFVRPAAGDEKLAASAVAPVSLPERFPMRSRIHPTATRTARPSAAGIRLDLDRGTLFTTATYSPGLDR
jgi:hypothetical protein